MVTRQEIITEARSWIGTPYIASQRAKQAGCDCVGLFWGITDQLKLDVSKDLVLQPNYEKYAFGNSLLVALRKYMDEVPRDQMDIGDLLVLRVGGVPTHVGILANLNGRDTLIHADTKRGVIETPLGYWLSKIVTVFRVRELV
jgi:NlpC/P60 family putative phage cell wall peptidase